MKILAVEFSSRNRSVAVLDSAPVVRVLAAGSDPRERETRPLTLIDQVLGEAGVEREDITSLAIGLGPGSYAGIRGAISLAQGWQIAREVALSGVSSADAAIAALHAEGIRGGLTLVVDTHRGDFHGQRYLLEDGGWRREGVFTAGLPAADPGSLVILGAGALPSGYEAVRRVEPAAEWVGRLALTHAVPSFAGALEPVYLRPVSFVKAPPPRLNLGGAGD